MRPLIGITADLEEASNLGRPWNRSELWTNYISAFEKAGANPVILPLAPAQNAQDLIGRLDGLVLSGGDDIPADALGEPLHPKAKPMARARWESECRWLEAALAMNKPVLGICLGMQIMNVAAGGKMIQDIPDQWPGAIPHGEPGTLQRHCVRAVEDTLLASLAPVPEFEVTSSHHQAVRDVPAPFRVAAVSPDGIIEAIEDPSRAFAVGVQWHPERHPVHPDWLLQVFVRHCANR